MREKYLPLPEIKSRFSSRPVRRVVHIVTVLQNTFLQDVLSTPLPTEVLVSNNNIFSFSNEVPSVPDFRSVEKASEQTASDLRYQQITFI
jgi:hypothetical protein